MSSKINVLKLKTAALQLEHAQIDKERQDDGTLFFQFLHGPFATATTDADGKFDMSLPKTGRFALAAANSRKVGDETEKYLWLVWVSLDGQDSKTLMLTNRNLTTESDPDNVLKQ